MKRMRLVAVLSVVLAVLNVEAEVLDPHAALQRALKESVVSSTRAGSLELAGSVTTEGGEPAVYMFAGTGITLLVSGDDMTPALLGWTERSASAGQSPEFRWWLGQYASQIAWLRSEEHPDINATRAGNETRENIAPLVKTRWNQTSPYNAKCPTVKGQRSMTGCVATAMAQALNYYRVADKGAGSIRYSLTDGQEVSFSYSETTLSWSQMLDSYGSGATQAQKDAVATLMFGCGASVQTEYSPRESGAVSEYIPMALSTYFGYSKKTRNYFRDICTAQEWDDIIYGQLRDFGPVIYSGSGDEGGHCFICDGYMDGYYHINWGWGGMDDGYFLLSALDPGLMQGAGGSSGGFNYRQVIVGNMQKAGSNEKCEPVVTMPYGFELKKEINNSTDSRLIVKGWVVNYSTAAIGINLGLRAVPETGPASEVWSGKNVSTMRPLYGASSYTVNSPRNWLSSPDYQGVYKVYPIMTTEQTGAVVIPVANGYPSYYTMRRNGGEFILEPEPIATVLISDIAQSVETPVGQYLSISGTVTNNTDKDFEGAVQLQLMRETKLVAVARRQELQLPSRTKAEFSYQAPLTTDTVGEGDYEALFVNPVTGSALSTDFTVRLTKAMPAKVKVTDFRIDDSEGAPTRENVRFTARVECTSGQLAEPLQIAIAVPVEGSSQAEVIMMANSQPLFLTAGESGEAVFSLSMVNAEANRTYLAAVFYNSEQVNNAIRFSFTTSGVDDVTDDSDTRDVIFDLSGRRLSNPNTTGVLIINGRKVLK